MKLSFLLFGLSLAALPIVSAQTPTPAPVGRQTYFGSSNPNGSAPAVKPSGADATLPSGPAAAEATVKPAPQKRAAPSADPEMTKALELLNSAKLKLQSKTSTNPKGAALPLVESARASLKRTAGDGRWHGHRALAMEKVKDTIAALKSGDRTNKAAGDLDESIAEVAACDALTK